MHPIRLRLAALALSPLVLAACGGGSTSIPATPDGTVQTVVDEIQKGNARVVWDAMPESYQKDVSELVHLFGKKMDAEVLQAGFSVVDNVVTLVEAKKDMILSMVKEQAPEKEYQKVVDNWDHVVAMLKTLQGSDLRDTGKLASLDVGAFMGSTGSQLLSQFKKLAPLMDENPFEEMKKLSFEAGEKDEDGNVLVTPVMGEDKKRPEKFQQVGGKWVPSEMARDWSKEIAKAKGELEKMDLSDRKPQIMKTVEQVNTGLEGLINAKDEAEFKKAAGGMMMMAMGLERMIKRIMPR